MTIKVHELARELETSSKELQKKCGDLGINISNHMSVLSDTDANRLRNLSKKAKSASETKIVKAAPRKVDKDQDEETPRVTVKAALRVPPIPVKQGPEKVKTEERGRTQKPPMGRPVISKEVEGRPKPPLGKPVVNKELDAREAEKAKAKEKATLDQQVQEGKKTVETDKVHQAQQEKP
ncbi:MAG: translation initiation factor IF-2 N-terminal domain-containing protein, partial [Anaerovoracaceae bacterium]|nr:translation initiation factor IF-2 N-terminal domain-containing protein [Anaerovoracaceae bacterium]